MSDRVRQPSWPIEDFVHALTSQLDRAQAALALKVKAGLPLTFAVKEIGLELKAFVETAGAVVSIRPAGPGETEASVLHLTLTTITRPMIEENTTQLATATDEPTLKDVLGDEISEEDRRRLEWAGIRNVRQLRELQKQSGETAIEQISNIPALRLRAALDRASRPFVSRVVPDGGGGRSSDASRLLRIRGQNLTADGPPRVRIGGETVPVVRASDNELVIAPLAHQFSGTVEVETTPGTVVAHAFDCEPPPMAREGRT